MTLDKKNRVYLNRTQFLMVQILQKKRQPSVEALPFFAYAYNYEINWRSCLAGCPESR